MSGTIDNAPSTTFHRPLAPVCSEARGLRPRTPA